MTFDNTVAKGEIAYNGQFLLLPYCFELCLQVHFHLQRCSLIERVCFRLVYVWKGLVVHQLFKTPYYTVTKHSVYANVINCILQNSCINV